MLNNIIEEILLLAIHILSQSFMQCSFALGMGMKSSLDKEGVLHHPFFSLLLCSVRYWTRLLTSHVMALSAFTEEGRDGIRQVLWHHGSMSDNCSSPEPEQEAAVAIYAGFNVEDVALHAGSKTERASSAKHILLNLWVSGGSLEKLGRARYLRMCEWTVWFFVCFSC